MLFILFRRKMLRAHLSPLLKIEFATFCQVLEPRYSATEQAMLLAWATHVKKGSAQVSLFFLCVYVCVCGCGSVRAFVRVCGCECGCRCVK